MDRWKGRARLRLEELERRDVPTATVSVFDAVDGAEGEYDGSFRLWRDETGGRRRCRTR